jgi:hypothetical protein
LQQDELFGGSNAEERNAIENIFETLRMPFNIPSAISFNEYIETDDHLEVSSLLTEVQTMAPDDLLDDEINDADAEEIPLPSTKQVLDSLF